ncbi:MAG: hypothetical protein JWQ11_3751, partial [Rhizobacter sp.]|nr:hypothetical protein [Rhizobacter sp.]
MNSSNIRSTSSAFQQVLPRPHPDDNRSAAATRPKSPPAWSSGSISTSASSTSTSVASAADPAAARSPTPPTDEQRLRDLLTALAIESKPNHSFQKPKRSISSLMQVIDLIRTADFAAEPVHVPRRLLEYVNVDSAAFASTRITDDASAVSSPIAAPGHRRSSGEADGVRGASMTMSLLEALHLIGGASINRHDRAAAALTLMQQAEVGFRASHGRQADLLASTTVAARPTQRRQSDAAMQPGAVGPIPAEPAVQAERGPVARAAHGKFMFKGQPTRFRVLLASGQPMGTATGTSTEAKPVARSSTVLSSPPGPYSQNKRMRTDDRPSASSSPTTFAARHGRLDSEGSVASSSAKPIVDAQASLNSEQFRARQIVESFGIGVPEGFRLAIPSAGASNGQQEEMRRTNTTAICALHSGMRAPLLAALFMLNDTFKTQPVHTSNDAIKKAMARISSAARGGAAASTNERSTPADAGHSGQGTRTALASTVAAGDEIDFGSRRGTATFGLNTLNMLLEHGIAVPKDFEFTIPASQSKDKDEATVRRTNTRKLLAGRGEKTTDSQVAGAITNLNAQFGNHPFLKTWASEDTVRQRLATSAIGFEPQQSRAASSQNRA